MLLLDTLPILACAAAAASASAPLAFVECSSSSDGWELTPSDAPNTVLLQQRMQQQTLPGGVGVEPAAVDGKNCAAVATNGVIVLQPCNTSDPAQQWDWNATTPNVRPAGSGGFAVLHPDTSAPQGCTDKDSTGCCLTDNGRGQPAALYGCCPSGPSDCGNQRFVLVGPNGTVRTLRDGGACLSSPRPPPAPIVSFEKRGMIDFKSYESTPLVFRGRKVLMETITLTYPGHISHWKPEFASCSSYFRLRDLDTGVVLVNLTDPVVDSCDHSFGSAFVDTLANGTEVLWVFGTSWYRPMVDASTAAATENRYLWPVGSSSGAGNNNSSTPTSFGTAAGWAGACGEGAGANCTVASFRTTDPTFATWTKSVALRPGRQSYNMDISTGHPNPQDGSKTYVMAIEQHPLPGAPDGSGWTSYFYIKDGPDAALGDLTTGWRLLPTASHVLGGGGTHGACPTIRYFPDADGGWYVTNSHHP